MRILADQNIDDDIVTVLRALHLDVTHVSELGHARTEDIPLFVIAREYDCFLTLDLHRQDAEWFALYTEMMNNGVAIVRVRMTNAFRDPAVEVTRALTLRIEDWMRHIEEGACLVIIAKGGVQIRARTLDDVAETLRQRRANLGRVSQ